MTLAPPEKSGDSGASDAASNGAPESGSTGSGDDIRPVVRQRFAKRKRQRQRAVIVQSVLTVAFVALLTGLAFVGWRSALKITGGRSIEVTDPAAPGYVAEVKPTPATLVAITGGPKGEGALASMLMVIENGPGDIKVVPISPLTTLWQFEDAPPETAEQIYADGNIDVLRLRLGADLTFGSTSALTVPAAAVEAIAAQAGPLTFENPDDVLEGASPEEATVKYPSGELTLQPEAVVEFLSFDGLREADSNRVLRSSQVWTLLFESLNENGASTTLTGVEGDGVDEFADLLDSISTTEVAFDQVPIVSEPDGGDPPGEIYRINLFAMPDWVSLHVSFPTSAYPGQRASVALLNGTTNDEAPRTVAPKVVFAGGEVQLTGNAESFDLATSAVEYSADEAKPAAERIATELGLTAVAIETGSDSDTIDVDVVVKVGKDLSP